MLRMSFFNGTLNRELAKEEVLNTTKKLTFRYGFSFRGARESEITKERALEIIKNQGYLDIDEYEDRICLNAYSSNDMW